MEILIAPKTQILCARAGKSEKLILTEFRKRKPEFLSLIFVFFVCTWRSFFFSRELSNEQFHS